MTTISIYAPMYRRLLLAGVAGSVLFGTPSAVLAQGTATPPGVSPGDAATAEVGNDIVVTARNRTERLQDVPLAITSISSQELADANVRNLRDVAYLTPGLSITSGGSEAYANPVIRGQTNLNAGAGDPNVGVFIDGIYINNPSAINVGLVDIERIEVVKGPVSALYGHNAFAGAINYVSKRPSTSVMSGAVNAFAGNDKSYSATGSITVPVVKDVLGVTLAGGYEHFGGSYKDQVNGQRAGGFKKRDVEGSVRFTPSKEFEVNASYYYGNDKFGPSALAYNANNCGARTNPASAQDPSGLGFSAYCGRFDPDAHPVEVPVLPKLAGAVGNGRKVNLARLNVSYDFGFAKLTSLTGYVKVDQQRYTDFIGRRAGIPFTLVPGPGVANLVELFGGNSNNKDFSEELRLQSAPDKPFRVQIGGFYYNDRNFNATTVGIDGTNLPAGQTLLPGFPADSLTANGQLSQKRITQALAHDKQYSGFVGAEYDVFTGLTVSGEYRYTHQKKDQLIIRNTSCPSTLVVAAGTCTGPAPTPYLYPNGTVPAAGKFNFSNYRGTVKYQVATGMNVYASVANGTKAGGFNQRATIPADLKFDPEKNVTYEIGSKNSLFDNKLQLNVALYHIDTKGIQISGPAQDPNNAGFVTTNFGSVHTNGFEVELAARVATGVRLNAGVGYADPKFGKDAYDFGAGSACRFIPQCAGRVIAAAPGSPLNPSTAVGNTVKYVLSLDGLKLPREANMQYTGGIDLDGPIGGGAWKWNGTFNARYESKQFGAANNIAFEGARTVLNLRVGVGNGMYSVSLYANNLTNDHTPEIISVNARLSDFGGDLDGYLPLGRQFGIMAGVRF